MPASIFFFAYYRKSLISENDPDSKQWENLL